VKKFHDVCHFIDKLALELLVLQLLEVVQQQRELTVKHLDVSRRVVELYRYMIN
jgi:hypothetical protein